VPTLALLALGHTKANASVGAVRTGDNRGRSPQKECWLIERSHPMCPLPPQACSEHQRALHQQALQQRALLGEFVGVGLLTRRVCLGKVLLARYQGAARQHTLLSPIIIGPLCVGLF
jgi:hypothetical protein